MVKAVIQRAKIKIQDCENVASYMQRFFFIGRVLTFWRSSGDQKGANPDLCLPFDLHVRGAKILLMEPMAAPGLAVIPLLRHRFRLLISRDCR